MKEKYCSVPEAADALGCSNTWVLKLLNKGELKGFKLSDKAWCVDRKDIQRNLERYLLRKKNKCPGRPRSNL